MSAKTGIQWTDATWNPIRGCSRVSDGCRFCYAEAVAARFSGPGQAYEGLARRRSNGEPQWTGEVRVIEKHMNDPLRWRTPRRIFVNSMSDLFHENVSDETIDRVFAIMALVPRHTFQVLTKRPARMRSYIGDRAPHSLARRDYKIVETIRSDQMNGRLPGHGLEGADWPLQNVWLGVSVENQATANERIPLLTQTPAAVRFLSCEPLLGPLDLFAWFTEPTDPVFRSLSRFYTRDAFDPTGSQPERTFKLRTPAPIDWVIVGGESGPHARPFDLAWARAIVQQCAVANVPAFVKQLGAVPMIAESEWRDHPQLLSAKNRDRVPGDFVPLKLYDSHGANMDEWASELRVRDFPAAR